MVNATASVLALPSNSDRFSQLPLVSVVLEELLFEQDNVIRMILAGKKK